MWGVRSVLSRALGKHDVGMEEGRRKGPRPCRGSHQLSSTGPVGSNPWGGRKMQGTCWGGAQRLRRKRRTCRKGHRHKEKDSFNGGNRARAPRNCFWLVVPV